jgi:hypothetical protein
MPDETMVAAYTLKCRYHLTRDQNLASINGNIDLLTELKLFCDQFNTSDTVNEDRKEIREVFSANLSNRNLSGFLRLGLFGQKGAIVRKGHGEVHTKTRDDADMRRFFFNAFIPADSSTGLLILEQVGTSGIAHVVLSEFSGFLKNKYPQLKLSHNRVMPHSYLDAVLNQGTVSKITFIRRGMTGTRLQKLENLGMHQSFGSQKLSLVPRRGQFFEIGQLIKDIFAGNLNAKNSLMELTGETETPDHIDLTVATSSGNRTVRIDSSGISRPALPLDVERDADGLAFEDKLIEITNDLINELYAELEQ